MADNPHLPTYPDLPSSVARIFRQRCQALLPAEAAQLWQAVETHLTRIRHAQQQNEFVDLAAAEAIADRIELLLDGYPHCPPPQQALIVGAVRYFIESQDAESDLHSILGLEDDVRVLNYVLAQLGHTDLSIDMP